MSIKLLTDMLDRAFRGTATNYNECADTSFPGTAMNYDECFHACNSGTHQLLHWRHSQSCEDFDDDLATERLICPECQWQDSKPSNGTVEGLLK